MNLIWIFALLGASRLGDLKHRLMPDNIFGVIEIKRFGDAFERPSQCQSERHCHGANITLDRKNGKTEFRPENVALNLHLELSIVSDRRIISISECLLEFDRH